MVNIANAIRTLTGTEEALSPTQMVTAIEDKAAETVETCTVTCITDLPSFDPIEIYYIDGVGEPQKADFLSVGTIAAQKNSYIFIPGWSGNSDSSGEIVEKFYYSAHALFYITGPATLIYR